MSEAITIQAITRWLESIAPLAYQEPYDNSGLLTGSPDWEVTKALLTLDCTEAVIGEAISKGCNLVIAHHPIIFGGLKKITGRSYVERTVIKAIKEDIAIYAIHTNLDNVHNGVNERIARQIGLRNLQILVPKSGILRKLVIYVPVAHLGEVQQALFNAGGGHIGNYDQCSFGVEGTGTFRPNEQANPFVGRKNELHKESETRLEVIFPLPALDKLIQALRQSHPYEEPAYDILAVENHDRQVGSGMIGDLETPMEASRFLAHVKENMQTGHIRYTPFPGKIRKVAVCGGAGSSLLKQAIHAGADAFVTADFKYHEFFDAEDRLMIADIGHYESEIFTKDLLKELILKKFPKFAVLLSETNTNPIKYY